MTAHLPSGTVAFLFTDIEGSTRLWERDAAAMWRTVHRHNAILGTAIADHGGHHFKTIGDAYQAAFPDVPSAVAAVAAAQRALAAEPWPETGPIRVRMAVHAGEATPVGGDYLAPCLNRLARLLATGHGGQALLTDLAAGLARDRLPPGASLRGLGRHRLRDLLEPEEVWQLVLAGLPDRFPPLKSLETHPTNLPAQPNELVGREAELAALLPRLTDPATRLLTLTGPGGVGKTRLALQLAADAIDAFPDGVFLVGLAAVTDPALLPAEIADTLGVREGGGLGLREALTRHLAPQRLLLLLDNLEQFRPQAAAARVVGDLLAAAPKLTVLATSRAPLRLRAEQEAPVAPLPTPDPRRHAPPGELSPLLAANPSVRLFAQRAQAARPSFALTADNAAAVVEIVSRLDGLPLAIELAAARTRALSVAELARRLGGTLDLLAAKIADLPDRQQTLRAAIDWSHDLLAPEEQALFRRLSVFPGGCTLEAAEAVAGVPQSLALDVLDGITVLLEQSLLRADETGDETRYRMLETLRAYGRERLAAAGEEEALLDARDAWLLARSVEADTHRYQADVGLWHLRLEAEHANIGACLDRALRAGRADDGMLLAANVWQAWRARGRLAEGRSWLDRLLAAFPGAPARLRYHALIGAGALAGDQGDLLGGTALVEEAVAVARGLADPLDLASTLSQLGTMLDKRGLYAEAAHQHKLSLDAFWAGGDRRGESQALNNLALVAQNRGNYDEATRMFEQSLQIKQELGNKTGMAITLNNLAVVAYLQDDLATATRRLEEALAIDRELDNLPGVADGLDNLGGILAGEQDLPRAAAMLAEALEIRRDMGDRYSIPFSLENVGALADATGDLAMAARMLGATESLREAVGMARPPDDAERAERDLATLRSLLGDFATDAALAAGRAMGWEAATEEALAYARRIAAGAGPTPTGEPMPPGGGETASPPS